MLFCTFSKILKTYQRYYTGLTYPRGEPLRILFFGNDSFSTFSLLSLNSLFQSNKRILEKLEVVTLSDMKIGRGHKILYRTPVKLLALEHNLKIHEIENGNMEKINNIFYSDGKIFNLAVTASFGHLIPSSFLKNIKFGGINVHPSLLPRYKGPAPLHHTLLNRDKYTGVTIQTLSLDKFDEGRIISISELYKIEKHETLESLSQKLSKIGANLLIQVLLKQEYLNINMNIQNLYEASYAKKMSKENQVIKWNMWDSDEIELRSRIFGKLKCKFKSSNKTVILSNIQIINDTEERIYDCPGLCTYSKDGLFVRCLDGRSLKIGKIKIEGKDWIDGKEWSRTCLKGKIDYFV
ncbi:methionyl-tRNA formyltransferase [Pneumocystis carinii B80]|uniref:Methionyl-tRNA formyltransferase, mitochondrial n=1 Tax=Pneumocystis carinii (strain B80) TaxID=1408658 RepID=A0A0W4ZMW8_PNEC8|nr:methionyl-tRNA formyltransferase [Pneumocystis carinii B80]KTW29722.1 methionyl-tRNA formyltransferase [Pneumocystis carinii B80]